MTLLTFSDKYVISSATPVSTTSGTLVDDTEASQTFDLAASKVVLVIYQANSVYGDAMPATGMQNAINIDGTDHANSWDSSYTTNYPVRNTVFWVGTLAAGSHTIKGRFASNSDGSTATISNRVLVIIIFDGDEFQYVDDATTASTGSTTLVDDPYAQVTFTPSATCKALILYNCANNGATESNRGKMAAINVAGTDYGQAEKSPHADNARDSVFTCHALSLSAVETTVKGRFAMIAASIQTQVTIHRRQLAVLLLADSTLLDISTSTTEVSTTSNTLVDDTEATLSRTTTDTRELLVVAMGTKRHLVSSSVYGERYGIKIDANDRANSRGSPIASSYANSAATAYAEQLAAGSHTVQGRFSNNYGTETAKISARQVIALWFFVPQVYSKILTETLTLTDALSRTWSIYRVSTESLGLTDYVLKSPSRILTESFSLTDVIRKQPRLSKPETLSLTDIIKKQPQLLKTEGLGLSDVITKLPSVIKTEVLGLTDIYSRKWSIYRVKTESLTLADFIQKLPSKLLSESLTLTDSLSKLKVLHKILEEILTLSDVLTKRPLKTLTETLTLTDVYSRVWILYRTYTETLGLTDYLQKKPARLLTESLALTDTITKLPAVIKTELLSLADYISKGISVSKSETLGLSDVLTKTPSLTRVEHLSLSDLILKMPILTRTESISLSDYMLKKVSYVRALTETLTLSDVLTKKVAVSLTETLSLADFTIKLAKKILDEKLILTDIYTRLWHLYRTYTEVLSLVDSIYKFRLKLPTRLLAAKRVLPSAREKEA